MQEQELRYCPDVKYLKVMCADDPEAQVYLRNDNYQAYVEVSDMFRLHDLLHRDEYEPVAVVRFHRCGEQFVRVYFRLLHNTDFEKAIKTSEGNRHQDRLHQYA